MAAKKSKRKKPQAESLQAVTDSSLTPQQIRGVESLVARGIDESMEDVAQRAGVTRMSMWRWMQLPEFMAEYRARVEAELGSHRARVAHALVQGAITPGPGQAAMQKIYWQRLGELSDKHEVSGPGGAPLEASVDWSKLPTPLLKKVLEALEER